MLPGDHLEASGDMSAVGAEESQLELTASGDVDVELSTESSGLTTNVVKRGVDGGEYLVELAKDLEQICKVELMAYVSFTNQYFLPFHVCYLICELIIIEW